MDGDRNSPGGASGGAVRTTAAGLCGVLVASVLWAAASRPAGAALAGSVGTAAPVAAAGAVGTVGSAVASEAPDEQSAMRMAYRKRIRVEVTGARTETSRRFANPDGTLSLEQFAVPQRVRRGSGWVPVSTRLKVAGDVVVPQATVAALRFSAGGTGPLVTIGQPGSQVSLYWPGRPPAPVLDGDTARYAEVLPGVDLLLRAGVDSFREVLVVKTPRAAADPALRRIAFRISAHGLALRQDNQGVITAVKPSGKAVFASDSAVMWDARREARIPVRLSGQELVVVPAQELLTEPVDGIPAVHRSVVQRRHRDLDACEPRVADQVVLDGRQPERRSGSVSCGRRSSDDELAGVRAVRYGCAGRRRHPPARAPDQGGPHRRLRADTGRVVARAGHISTSSAVTWNNTADGGTGAPLQTVSVAANEASCPTTDKTIEFGNANVKDLMQDTATGTSPR